MSTISSALSINLVFTANILFYYFDMGSLWKFMMGHFPNVTFWKTSLESKHLSLLCLSQVVRSVLLFIIYILVPLQGGVPGCHRGIHHDWHCPCLVLFFKQNETLYIQLLKPKSLHKHDLCTYNEMILNVF